MSMDEIRRTIRSDFKKLGITNRQVGLNVEHCGYSVSVRATIKDFTLSTKFIGSIINKHKVTRRDEKTFETLEGANTYVSISYDYDRMDEEMALRHERALEIEERLKKAGNGSAIELFETDRYKVEAFPTYHENRGLGNIYVRDKKNPHVRHEYYLNYCEYTSDIERFLVIYDFQLSRELA